MPRVTLQNLGAILRAKRGAIGIREAAKEVGTSPATLSRIESGHLPDLNTFGKICQWLQLDPAEILGVDRRPDEALADSGITAAHLRVDKETKPATARALANVIMAAQRMLESQPRDR